VTLSGFDTEGNVVSSQTLSGPQGITGIDLDWLVSSENGAIVRAQLSGRITGFGGYGIDDLVLERSVAEPGFRAWSSLPSRAGAKPPSRASLGHSATLGEGPGKRTATCAAFACQLAA
jgi:hypothetical protein